MEKINKNPEEEAAQMTDKEMAEMRKNITAQYKEEIGFLKIQSQYEDLMATIEESKFRRYSAMARSSQLFAQMEQAAEHQEDPGQDFEKAKAEAAMRAAETEKQETQTKEYPRKKRTLATE